MTGKYGFIRPDLDEPDCFFHLVDARGCGAIGDRVTFEVTIYRSRVKAIDVKSERDSIARQAKEAVALLQRFLVIDVDDSDRPASAGGP